MKRLILFLLLILIFVIPSNAQNIEKQYPFVSAAFGSYQTSAGSNHNKSRLPNIVFGAGFGLPIVNNIFAYGKLSYFSKSNYTGYENLDYLSNSVTPVNQLTAANVSFSQFIFNGGVQYRINLSDDFNFGLMAGFTYALVNQEASLPGGTILQRLDNEGVFGYFGGAGVEHKFTRENLSLFGEAIYNYAKKDVIYFRDKFSGMNFTVGARYYFIGR